MSWRPWKATVTGRTEEVNELEERKFSSLSRSDMDMMTRRSRILEKKYGKGAKHVKLREEEAEKKRIKDEKHRQQGAATKRPHWAVKKAFAPPKQTDSGYGGRIATRSGDGVDGQPPLRKPRREDKALHPS